MTKKYCGAKTRSGGKCKRPAGWGTDHVGDGKCKLHGGCAGAPIGNSNGVSHGIRTRDMFTKYRPSEKEFKLIEDHYYSMSDLERLKAMPEVEMFHCLYRMRLADERLEAYRTKLDSGEITAEQFMYAENSHAKTTGDWFRRLSKLQIAYGEILEKWRELKRSIQDEEDENEQGDLVFGLNSGDETTVIRVSADASLEDIRSTVDVTIRPDDIKE